MRTALVRTLVRALAGAVLLALSGCSVRSVETEDGPGVAIDTEAIPDAVPKQEPKSDAGNPDSYVVHGERYEVRDSSAGYVAKGRASWYGRKFHGRVTSSGERYDMYAMTAAHRTLPLPTYARVTNLENGRSVIVRINDRGPFHEDRLIDLSYAAAARLGVLDAGTARVRVRALTDPGAGDAGEAGAADGGSSADPAALERAAGAVYFQVGAFAQFANAQTMRARVQGADVRSVEVERGRNSAGKRIYRVRVGPLADAERRRAVRAKLERAGIEPIRVVRE